MNKFVGNSWAFVLKIKYCLRRYMNFHEFSMNFLMNFFVS